MLKTVLLLFFLVFQISSFAADPEIFYEADVIKTDQLQKLELIGNVKIIFDVFEITSQKATLLRADKSFTAEGKIRFLYRGTVITADRLSMNFETRNADLENITLTSGQVFLKAKNLKKTSVDIFEAYEAQVTTCQSCPPAWGFEAKKIVLKLGDWIDVYWGWIQILEQSILPIPKLRLPIYNRRETGFLPAQPDLSLRSPFLESLELAYFYAPAVNYDFTLTQKTYFGRGLKTKLEYRHVFSYDSDLTLNMGHMWDTEFPSIRASQDIEHRFFGSFVNKFNLGWGLTQKTQLNWVKELNYLPEFPEDISGHQEPSLQSEVQLIKNFNHHHLSLTGIYNLDLLRTDVTTTNQTAIHKLPEVQYHLKNKFIFSDFFELKLQSQYINFVRFRSHFDNVVPTPASPQKKSLTRSTSVQSYTPGQDLIRSGQRLMTELSLTRTQDLGDLFHLTPELFMNQSLYALNPQRNNKEFLNRLKLGIDLKLETQFSKVYRNKYKHLILPVLTFRESTDVFQKSHYFFNPSENRPSHRLYQPVADFDFFEQNHGVQFDYRDRLQRERNFQLEIYQYIFRKESNSELTTPFTFYLSQSFDLLNLQRSSSPDPWGTGLGRMKITTPKYHQSTQLRHHYKSGTTSISTSHRYILQPGYYGEVRYFHDYLIDRLNTVENELETISVGVGWEVPYFHFSGHWRYDILDEQHLGWRVNALFIPPGNCWQVNLSVYNNIQRFDEFPEIRLQIDWTPSAFNTPAGNLF